MKLKIGDTFVGFNENNTSGFLIEGVRQITRIENDDGHFHNRVYYCREDEDGTFTSQDAYVNWFQHNIAATCEEYYNNACLDCLELCNQNCGKYE